MRLSNRILNIIKQCIYNSFGDVKVYLFGSRADDTKKGGDIDLAIDTCISSEEFKNKKIKFLTSMIRLGFELKIDLVRYKNDDRLLCQEIKNNSIRIL